MKLSFLSSPLRKAGLLTGFALLLTSLSASAQTKTIWENAPGGGGDWFNDSFWSKGVPNGSRYAWINGPTSIIGSGQTATASSVNVGVQGGDGSLLINGILNTGSISVGRGGGGTVTVDGAGALLNVPINITFGSGYNSDLPNGDGEITVRNGGKVTASSFYLGSGVDSRGTVNIGSGSGTSGGILDIGSITGGNRGSGTVNFNHNGTQMAPYYFTRNGLAVGQAVGLSYNLQVNINNGYTVFSGNNSYTGGTNLNGGTLEVGSNGFLGSTYATTTSNLNFNGGTLRITGDTFGATTRAISVGGNGGTIDIASANATVTLQNSITGSGNFIKQGLGTLATDKQLALPNNTLDIQGGTFKLNFGAANSVVKTLNLGANGTLDFGSGGRDLKFDIGTLSGSGLISEGIATWALSIGSGTFSGRLAMNASLTKVSDGTLTLSGDNNQLGADTTVSGGILNVTGNNASFNSDFVINGTPTTRVNFTKTVTFGNSINATNGIFSADGVSAMLRANSHVFIGNGKGATNGSLILSNGATLTDAYNVTIAYSAANKGTLVIGSFDADAPVAPGKLVGGDQRFKPTITGGSGDATLSLRHTDTSGNFTIDHRLTGGLKIVSSSGTTVFTQDNTYTGKTSLVTGAGTILQLGNGGTTGTLGTGAVDIGAGTTLAFNHSDAITVANVISGAGQVTQIGGGVLTLSGNNSYTGGTQVTSGVLAVTTDTNLGGGSGVLGISNSATFRTLGAITMNRATTLGTGGGIFDITNGNVELQGVISGTGSLTKTGKGAILLSGTNTYTGYTQINGGTLAIRNDASLGNANGALGLNGGTLSFKDLDITMNRATSLGTNGGTFSILSGSLTQNGAISGSGLLRKAGGGTLVLGGTNTYTGGTQIDAGTVQISADANLGAPNGAIVTTGGTLHTTGSFTTSRNITMNTGGGIFDTDGMTTLTENGILQGTGLLRKQGDGTLVLTGTNTYAGNTQINAGVLSIASDASLGKITSDVVLNGGTLRATASITTARDIMLEYSTNGTLDIPNSGDLLNLSGIVKGSGHLFKTGDGKLILNGKNTYTGDTTVTGGTVFINSDANLGNVAGNLILNGGTLESKGNFAMNREFTLGDNGGTFDQMENTTWTLNAPVNGTGNLTKRFLGTLVLAGRGGYSGKTIVEGGNVQIGSGGTTGTLGLGDVELGSGTGLLLNRKDDTIVTNTITGAGSVTQNGPGAVALSGTNTYTGGTVINKGILAVSVNTALGDAAGGLTFNGGTLQATKDITMSRATTLGANGGSISVYGGATLTQNGVISGSGALTKIDLGTLVLGGVNTYTGGTKILGGAVSISADENLGVATSTLQIDSAALNVTDSVNMTRNILLDPGDGVINVTDAANTLSLAGIISGAGALVNNGPGTIVLTENNTYGGGTRFVDGTIAISSNANLGKASGALTFDGGSLRTDAGFTMSRATTLNAGGGNISVTAGVLTQTGKITGTGALYKSGAGGLTLTTVNTYSAGTIIYDGTLTASNTKALGTGDVFIGDHGKLALTEAVGDLPNMVTMLPTGGRFTHALKNGATYAHALDATSYGTNTAATILAGKASSARTLASAFEVTSAAGNDDTRLSDLYHLEGTGSDLATIQLSVSTSDLGKLSWLDGANWVNAVDGNTGNNATPGQQGFIGSFSDFQKLYGNTLNKYIGAWGTVTSDTGVLSAWAVLNHDGDFAITANVMGPTPLHGFGNIGGGANPGLGNFGGGFTPVPEPSTWMLLGLGAAALLFLRRRKVA